MTFNDKYSDIQLMKPTDFIKGKKAAISRLNSISLVPHDFLNKRKTDDIYSNSHGVVRHHHLPHAPLHPYATDLQALQKEELRWMCDLPSCCGLME